MTEIVVEIKSCSECPNFEAKRIYTADSFEHAHDWYCKKKDKKIQGYVEWHEEKDVQVPEWCPIIHKK